ncbi:MAG: GPR endopeptidase [Clostridia bacterium]|nr:GPR endopeptidase [Clostridia bacterium]
MYNFRTDLAVERTEIYKKINNIKNDIDGVKQEKNVINKDIEITRVSILNEDGEKVLGKKKGNYITLDIKNLKIAQEEEIQQAAENLSKELKVLVGNSIKGEEEVLIIGLGNEKVTPDSLGPKVVSDIEVTRHLIKYVPQYVKPGTRPVSALAPGVLGTTGMETLEIIKGVVDNVKPKLLIVIDALSARNIRKDK